MYVSHRNHLSYCTTIILTVIQINIAMAAERPGAVFLSIPPGAKALARGAGFTGDCSDPSSFYYNPAAIAFHDKFGLIIVNQGLPPGIGRLIEQGLLAATGGALYGEVIHPEPAWLTQLQADMTYNNGYLATSMDRIGNLGLHVTYLNTGITEVRDYNGTYLGAYETYDAAVGVSFGRTIASRFGIGITGKYIYSLLIPAWVFERFPELEIDNGGIGTAWAMDIGTLYKMRGVVVGASVQNLGTHIRYTESGSSDRLPLRIRGSIAIEPLVVLDSLFQEQPLRLFNRPIHDIINVSCNYDRAYDPENLDDTWVSTGCELTLLNLFSYRIGKWNIFGSTSGVGFNLRNVEIDVAKYFDYDTYHVQLTLHSAAPPEDIRNNRRLNTYLILGSSALAPGGGQFYKGEGIKGSLFFVPSLYLGRTILTEDSGSAKTLSAIGLVALYLASGIEALWNK